VSRADLRGRDCSKLRAIVRRMLYEWKWNKKMQFGRPSELPFTDEAGIYRSRLFSSLTTGVRRMV